jgi:hypothetical protein
MVSVGEIIDNEIKQEEKTPITIGQYAREVVKKEEPQIDDEAPLTIADMFDHREITKTTQGWKMECPYCGLQGGRTEGFILFPDNNGAYCQSSGKHFQMLEAYALRKKVITCMDGTETGEKRKVLGGELFSETLDHFKNEFGTEKYNKLINQLFIRKKIQVPGPGRYISDFCDELADIYKSRNNLFVKTETGEVVEIIRKTKKDKNGTFTHETTFEKVTPAKFITIIERFTRPYKVIPDKDAPDGYKEQQISISPTLANTVLESQNLKDRLPNISRIYDVQIPIIYKDQLTFPKKGYDERFESWLSHNAPLIMIGHLPTEEEAKAVFDYIFSEFCFKTERDRMLAIAMFITPGLRGLYERYTCRTPIGVYLANRERAGKDYLAGCTGIMYEGANIQEPPISSDGKSNDSEELRKKLTSAMMIGRKRYHSANNRGDIRNVWFEQATTSETQSDRLLGKNQTIVVPNEIDYSISGNLGIKITPDLSYRSRIITLHLSDEDPNARVFKNPDLHGWILKNRSLIISAIYVLIKKWYDAGKPKSKYAFTSFPDWSHVCGGIMDCAGYENPCKPDLEAFVVLDNETSDMKFLFEKCYEKFKEEWITKEDIKEVVKNEDLMQDLDLEKHGDKTKFGLRIDKYVKRIMSGLILEVFSETVRADRRKYRFKKQLVAIIKEPEKVEEKNDQVSVEIFDEKVEENETKIELNSVKSELLNHTNTTTTLPNNLYSTNGSVGMVGRVIYKDREEYIDTIDRVLHTDTATAGAVRFKPSTLPPHMVGLPNPATFEAQKPENQQISSKILEENSAETSSSVNLKNQQISSKILDQKTPQNSTENLLEIGLKKQTDFITEIKNQTEPKERVKTDRELQYWEAPESKNIVQECTKEQVLAYVTEKSNSGQGVSLKELRDTLGLGAGAHLVQLKSENLVEKLEDGWRLK